MPKSKAIVGKSESAALQRDGIHVPVRWIVPSIGAQSSSDVSTVFSFGENRELVEEVSYVCRAFHPINGLRAFPKIHPVYLFWRAESTGDWIVGEVTATDQPHDTLAYSCLVFEDISFHALRCNPFRVRSLNLHARLRAHLEENRIDPFRCTIPRSAVPNYQTTDVSISPPIVRQIPGVSADRLPNETNLSVIREYCSQWTDRPVPPPSFATWWSGENDVPANCFDVVLRCPAPRPLTTDGVRSAVSEALSVLKNLLSLTASADGLTTVDFVQLILLNVNSAENAMARSTLPSHATDRNRMQHRTPNDFSEVTIHLGRIRTRLNSLVNHLDSQTAISDISDYMRLSEQILELEHSLQAISNSENPVVIAKRTPFWPLSRSNRQSQNRSVNLTSMARPIRFGP